MTAGVDKLIEYVNPGAIGLFALDPVVQLRLNEPESAMRPQDDAGRLADLDVAADLVMPSVFPGVTGAARMFEPSAVTGLQAGDRDPGAEGTLLTRNMTIQAIVSWEALTQDAGGQPGVIVARGTSTGATEYIAYALEVVVVSAPSAIGELRWVWQDTAGVVHVQTGGQFVMGPSPAAPGFVLLTATRRWVSPTEVVLRYYVGDQRIAEVTSTDGSIAGDTLGTFMLGFRRDLAGAAINVFAGRIDEVLILDREITLEEVESEWLRIVKYQPYGIRLFREMHDQGFTLPQSASADANKEIDLVGQALGFAASAAEDVRANILPQRAYGKTLEDWEEATRPTPSPSSSVEERRARVVARLRQKRGVSIGGLGDALVGLLGGATADDLEFIAFNNTPTEPFDTLNLTRWDVTPAASWAAVAGKARSSPAAGTYTFDGATEGWRYLQRGMSGGGKQAHVLASVVMTTPQSNLEAGLFVGERAAGDYLLVGLRDVAGSFRIYTESYIAHASQGLVLQATLGANPAALWLHLYQTTTDGTWKVAWSTTSATAGYTTSGNITHPTLAYWCGAYVRSAGAIAGAGQVDVDDLILRDTYGTRPLNAYVLLDEGLGFTPDVAGANSTVRAIKHAYTHGAFITKRELLAGDPDTPAGIAPCGGY